MFNISLTTLTSLIVAFAFVTPSSAAESFAKKHPRRAEVVKRDKNEIKKNEEAEKDGKITKNQEKKLNEQDRKIRKEEQADAAAHGGHITKEEKRDLNQQENAVNRERNQMEKRDNPASTPAAH